MSTLTNDQIARAGLGDWRKLALALHARFLVPDALAGASFVAAIAEALPDRLPELRLTSHVVDVAVATHDGPTRVTEVDIGAARTVSELARRNGLRPDPMSVGQVEFGLDSARYDVVGPFWAALLTGNASNAVENAVTDPTGRVPTVWFQAAEQIDRPPQRWHPDVWVAPEAAAPRIAAAVQAGGAVVDESHAPSFTVLADPDGNLVCVCTSLDR